MEQPITSVVLMSLTTVAAGASVWAWRGLRRGRDGHPRPTVSLAMGLMLLASLALLLGRWWHSGELTRPLHAHVDGLVLIAALLLAALLYLRWRPRMLMVSVIGLPVLTFLYAWAVCAAAWTYQPFRLESLTGVWSWLHLMGVYVGTLCFVVGAVAAAAYLYVHRRIKLKDELASIGRLPSLEKLEGMVIHTATVGFVVLSIGLIGGIIVLGREPGALSRGGWMITKIVMAVGAWLIYAVLINVRFSRRFRGPRAAWLSIAGLVLIIATYGLVTALPSAAAADEPTPSAAAASDKGGPG